MKTLIVLTIMVVIAAFIPWRDWIMALRIRSAKKSIVEGREVINRLEQSIAEIKAKMASDEKFACLQPLLKSLEGHRERLVVSLERFTTNVEFVEELRRVVNHKSSTPNADATIAHLNMSSEKMDEFLKKLNGDK